MTRGHERGFTLIELIIVFTLVGILVGLALPNYQNAIKKGREAVLKEDLHQLRKLIGQYYADKSKYPPTLQTLVDEKYLYRIPEDPMTGKPDWTEIREEPTAEEIEPGKELGIVDVKSSSELKALDGTVFNTW